MKLSKGLFLAFAGLGLFACSNEDVTENGGQIEGPADVVVKLDLPGFVNGVSRAVETEFTTNKIVNPSYVVVTVEGKKGATVEREYTTGETITIQGVEDPTSIKVEINTKKESGEDNWTDVPYSTFAELNKITVAGTRMIGTVSGAENFGVSGENYTVTVPVKHTMARLEFGGIKHSAHSGGTCRFKDGDLAGVFLNHVQLHSTAVSDDPKDYTEDDIKGANFFSGDGSTGWWDAITGTDFFPNESATYPLTGCYAYNIYPVEANNATALPVLTLYFKNLQEQEDATSHFVGSDGFALVKTYKVSKTTMDQNPTLKTALCGTNPTELDNGQNYQVINFPAGYIYQIKSLSVPDEAVHPDPTGEGVNLVATITLINWEIVAGSVDWK